MGCFYTQYKRFTYTYLYGLILNYSLYGFVRFKGFVQVARNSRSAYIIGNLAVFRRQIQNQ
jgi:hypothetical protein